MNYNNFYGFINIILLFGVLSCRTGPNYYTKISPYTVKTREKVVSKEIKRNQRKLNKTRKNKTRSHLNI